VIVPSRLFALIVKGEMMLGCLIWLIVLLILASMVAWFVLGVLAGVMDQSLAQRVVLGLLAGLSVCLGVLDMGNVIEGWISIGGDLLCLALLGAGYLLASLVIGIQYVADCDEVEEADSQDCRSATGVENQLVVRLYIFHLKGFSMAKISIPTPDEILNARKGEEIDAKTREQVDSILTTCVKELESKFKGYNCVYVNFEKRLEIPVAERVVKAFKEKGWRVQESSTFSTTLEFSRLTVSKHT
jgi:hypothetical protein